MKLKILVVQNNPDIGNKTTTFTKTKKLLDQYKNIDIDLIVFPEVWSIGWYCKNFKKESEQEQNSDTIAFLQNVAQEFNSLVIGGSFIKKFSDDEYRNTCPIISKKGKLLTTYDKMHLFSHKGSEENKYVSTGDELKILNINKTKIGLSICYDIRFPELYREYSKNGVEIFINMAAWSNTKPEHWQIMHKARAIENQCYMVVANQTGKITGTEFNLGHSMVINPWGESIAELESQEECLLCEIDTQNVNNLRENFPLIADRRDSHTKTFNIKEIKINE